MDVGNSSYQRTWEQNVARELRKRHWDGVFVDDIAQTMQHPDYLAGRVLAKYPGKDDYARATTSFLSRVGPLPPAPAPARGRQRQRRRRPAVGAVARLPLGRDEGVVDEGGHRARRDFLTGSNWRFQTQLLQEAQAHGKIFVAITYGPAVDAAAMAYARASFLLFADGGRSAFVYSSGCSGEPGRGRVARRPGLAAGQGDGVGAGSGAGSSATGSCS